jgi:REP element-mobilizing transposase RayT
LGRLTPAEFDASGLPSTVPEMRTPIDLNRNVAHHSHAGSCLAYRRRVLPWPAAPRPAKLIPRQAADNRGKLRAVEVLPDHDRLLVGVGEQLRVRALTESAQGVFSRVRWSESSQPRPSPWTNSYFVNAASVATADVVKRLVRDGRGR